MTSSQDNLQELIKILSKPVQLRTGKDVQQAVQATKYIEFFRNITEKEQSDKIHLMCCKALSYREYEDKEVICHTGEPGNEFYIILEGSVRVLITNINASESVTHPEPVKQENTEKPQRKSSATPRNSFLPLQFANKIKQNPKQSLKDNIIRAFTQQTQPEEPPEDPYGHMLEVNQLQTGSSFGEMALLKDAPRNATIQCTSECKIAILYKEDYKQILADYQQSLINSKVNFLRSMKPFER